MAQEARLKIKGRYVHPSDLSEVPDGALTVAKNVNIDRESIATPRRGVDRYDYGLSTSSERVNKIYEYLDALVVHHATNKLSYDNGSAWTSITTDIDPPDAANPVRSAQASQNLYLTSDEGIKKLDGLGNTLINAGAPQGLSLELALNAASGGFLAVNSTVGYRCLWGYEDANGNLILGAPSQTASVSTAGTAKNVDVTVTIPDEATTSWIFQVYRSAQVASGSPSEEMNLVYEANPTAGEITAGEVTFTDITSDTIVGATLYTSPSQETILGANNTPPLAKDIEPFKGHMFYANTTGRHRLTLTLLANLANNDEITIDGDTYTAKTSPSTSTEFQLSASGSVAQAIEETAKALCAAINSYATNTTINAYYGSGFNDTPGDIILEARTIGGSSFAVTFNPAGATDPWNPSLPTSGTDVSSDNDEFKNGLRFSKFQQPEAVPLGNILRVGSASDSILRVMALRDSLFLLSEGGVYRVTGEDAASFRLELFDETVKLIGNETAVKLNNAIYFLSDQGVIQLTETGASVISRPIEKELLETIGRNLAGVKSYSFAVGYETERKYILGVPNVTGDTEATKFHVYNTFTNAWTTWEDLSAKTGFVNPVNDKLYLSDSGSEFLLEERKAFDNTDHVDYLDTVTISAVTGTLVTVNKTDSMTVGDVIWQSASRYAVIESIDTTAGTVTTYFDGGLTAAAATLYSGISTEVEWAPFAAGNPMVSKHFMEAALAFKTGYRLLGQFGFSTDFSGSTELVDAQGGGVGGWGLFPWGTLPWGGVVGRLPVRTLVPRDKARANLINLSFRHRVGYTNFELYGGSLIFNMIGERFSR